jgi:hypothetical protein
MCDTLIFRLRTSALHKDQGRNSTTDLRLFQSGQP